MASAELRAAEEDLVGARDETLHYVEKAQAEAESAWRLYSLFEGGGLKDQVERAWEATQQAYRSEQMSLPRSRTNPELVTARFLLKPGRRYEEAVKLFQPYNQAKEINAEARQAGLRVTPP